MAGGYHVYSTLANDQSYNVWSRKSTTGGVHVRDKKLCVVIAGKVGVINKNFLTPRGMVTAITDEQYELLQENHVFKIHKENGYVKVEKRLMDPEKAAATMTSRDVSDPRVAEDFIADGIPEPVLGPKKAKK